MLRSPRQIVASVSFLCLSLALPAAARADHVIDSFQTSFSPGFWVGTNGSGATQDAQQQSQGQRTATLTPTVMSNLVTATIDTTYRKLSYRTRDLAGSGTLNLTYGQSSDLNLDLSGDNRFKIVMTSNLGCHQYLPVTIGVTCAAGNTVQRTYNLANGTYLIRFSDFQSLGCDFSHVSRIVYYLNAAALNRLSFDLTGGLQTVYVSGY